MKNETQDDGYETCGADTLTPNSHSNLQLTPQHHHYTMNQSRNVESSILMPKHDTSVHDDPYNFVDDETNPNTINMDQRHYHNQIEQRQEKLVSHENMYNHHMQQPETYTTAPTIIPNQGDTVIVQKKRGRKKKGEIDTTKTDNVNKSLKERKKHDRFNGMSEDEVSKRTLPDHLATNLDIVIVSQDQ